MKVCKTCKEEKEINRFPKNRNKCKDCQNKDKKRRREQIKLERDINDTKTCSCCNIKQSIIEFQPQTSQCKKCLNKKKRERGYKTIIKTDIDPNITKTCSCCQLEKSMTEYKPQSAQCKDCVNKKKRERRAKEKQKKIDSGEIKVIREPTKEGHKVCPYCDVERPNEMFRKNRRKCLECERENGRKYRKSELGKKKSQKWVEDNSEQMAKLQANWYQDNKDKINEKYRERYHYDINFKLIVNNKSRINNALNNAGKSKHQRTVKYLDCTPNHLANWLSYNFTDKMNFENHGSYWHMDHVIPVNKFDLTDPEQVKLCFNWKNLTPMVGKENMSKHDDIVVTQLSQHFTNLLKYYEDIIGKSLEDNSYLKLCATHLVAGNSLES